MENEYFFILCYSIRRGLLCFEPYFLPNNKYSTIEIQRDISPDKNEKGNWFVQGDGIIQSVGDRHQNVRFAIGFDYKHRISDHSFPYWYILANINPIQWIDQNYCSVSSVFGMHIQLHHVLDGIINLFDEQSYRQTSISDSIRKDT